jgi:hypothetical protein
MVMNRREKEKKKARTVSSRQWAGEQTGGFESKAVKLPDGVEYYKQEDGDNLIDMIPYEVKKGKGTPGGNPRAEAGFLACEREYQTHRLPGTGKFNDAYCCRRVCFGKKCPCCEWLIANARTADEDLVISITGQLRHLWIVNDKPGKLKNKLKVFDSNHKNRKLGFGQQLKIAIEAQLDEDECFYDLEEGKQVKFIVEGEYKHVPRIDFKDRDYQYPESILDHGIDLDECLIDVGYDAMKEALETGLTGSSSGKEGENGDGEDSAPKKGKKKPAASHDDEEEEEESDDPTAEDLGIEKGAKVIYKKKECEVMKVSGDGTSLTLEDEDGEPIKGVAPNEVKLVEEEEDDEEEEEEEEKPAAKKKGKKPADDEEEEEEDSDDDDPLDDDDDDGDDDDDEEEEEEEEEEDAAPKKGKKKTARK